MAITHLVTVGLAILMKLAEAEEKSAADMISLEGVVKDVIYLGLYTRYLVEVSRDVNLVVIEQNLKTTSMDVLSTRGQKVKLSWHKDHISRLGS